MSADMGMTAREFWADDGKCSERIMAALAVIDGNRKTTEAAHRPLTPQSRCSALSSEDATRPTPEFCGDEQPHEGHEFLHGARRYDCPGVPIPEVIRKPSGIAPDRGDATRPTGDKE